MPRMTAEELADFLAREFPQSQPSRATIEELGEGFVRIRRRTDASDLRPGGTLSGPTLMGLADHAMYVVLLSMIGPVALAVTTSLTIHFLRKPAPGDLLAEASILKLGQRLAVGEVILRSEEAGEAVAHCTVTYSIPPR